MLNLVHSGNEIPLVWYCRYKDGMAEESQGLPFKVVPTKSSLTNHIEPYLQVGIRDQAKLISPEEIGSLIINHVRLKHVAYSTA